LELAVHQLGELVKERPANLVQEELVKELLVSLVPQPVHWKTALAMKLGLVEQQCWIPELLKPDCHFLLPTRSHSRRLPRN